MTTREKKKSTFYDFMLVVKRLLKIEEGVFLSTRELSPRMLSTNMDFELIFVVKVGVAVWTHLDGPP